EDGIRDGHVTGVQTCALPISNVCRRETERRARHTNRSIDRKAAAAIVRIGYIEIDRSVAVLCVVADVHIIGILVDGEGWQNAVKIGRASCRERVEILVDVSAW